MKKFLSTALSLMVLFGMLVPMTVSAIDAVTIPAEGKIVELEDYASDVAVPLKDGTTYAAGSVKASAGLASGDSILRVYSTTGNEVQSAYTLSIPITIETEGYYDFYYQAAAEMAALTVKIDDTDVTSAGTATQIGAAKALPWTQTLTKYSTNGVYLSNGPHEVHFIIAYQDSRIAKQMDCFAFAPASEELPTFDGVKPLRLEFEDYADKIEIDIDEGTYTPEVLDKSSAGSEASGGGKYLLVNSGVGSVTETETATFSISFEAETAGPCDISYVVCASHSDMKVKLDNRDITTTGTVFGDMTYFDKWSSKPSLFEVNDIELTKDTHVLTFTLTHRTNNDYYDFVKLMDYIEIAPKPVELPKFDGESALRLEFEEYASRLSMPVDSGTYTPEEVDKSSAGSGASGNGKYLLVSSGTGSATSTKTSSFTLSFEAEKAGYCDINYVICASHSIMQIHLDSIDITSIGTEFGDTTYFGKWNSMPSYSEKKNVYLSQGEHNITFEFTTRGGSSSDFVKLMDYIEIAPKSSAIIDFSIENENGNRMAYAIRSGLKAYGVVTICKDETVSDKMLMIIAQYSGKEMVSAEPSVIDISGLSNGATKKFRQEITLSGSSERVKVFLMDYETLAPLTEAETYMQAEIFDEDILNTTVGYQLATNTPDTSGVNYSEYGVHDENYDIDAIFYDGHNGTKVFAYIGIPKNASATNKVPAMVLVHGGAGKAEISWVKKWNDLGVAAIAMDLYGKGPDRVAHPYAGVGPFDNTAFFSDYETAGMYQNVVSVVNAHNILRANEKIDSSKIGITGISWGGVTTNITIGVDNRFLFAVPVYGCGYLDENRGNLSGNYSDYETIHWDPANFAARAEMPVLYINGDQDPYFSANITTATASVVKNSAISYHHALNHSQSSGDSLEQVYRFAQNMFNGVNTNVVITASAVSDGTLSFSYTAPQGTTVESAKAYYITTDDLTWGGGPAVDWKTVTAYTEVDGTITFDLPDDATHCYASITDNYGDIISTKFMKAD